MNARRKRFVQEYLKSGNVKLSTIKLNPRNPRSISETRFKALCKSLKEFPQMMALRPLVVDKAGTLLGGNMRFQALKANGMTEIPADWVKRADKLTPAQIRRFIIADNLPFGEWSWDELANDFDVKELTEFGFDEKELLGNFEINGQPVDLSEDESNKISLHKCPKCGFSFED